MSDTCMYDGALRVEIEAAAEEVVGVSDCEWMEREVQDGSGLSLTSLLTLNLSLSPPSLSCTPLNVRNVILSSSTSHDCVRRYIAELNSTDGVGEIVRVDSHVALVFRSLSLRLMLSEHPTCSWLGF